MILVEEITLESMKNQKRFCCISIFYSRRFQQYYVRIYNDNNCTIGSRGDVLHHQISNDSSIRMLISATVQLFHSEHRCARISRKVEGKPIEDNIDIEDFNTINTKYMFIPFEEIKDPLFDIEKGPNLARIEAIPVYDSCSSFDLEDESAHLYGNRLAEDMSSVTNDNNIDDDFEEEEDGRRLPINQRSDVEIIPGSEGRENSGFNSPGAAAWNRDSSSYSSPSTSGSGADANSFARPRQRRNSSCSALLQEDEKPPVAMVHSPAGKAKRMAKTKRTPSTSFAGAVGSGGAGSGAAASGGPSRGKRSSKAKTASMVGVAGSKTKRQRVHYTKIVREHEMDEPQLEEEDENEGVHLLKRHNHRDSSSDDVTNNVPASALRSSQAKDPRVEEGSSLVEVGSPASNPTRNRGEFMIERIRSSPSSSISPLYDQQSLLKHLMISPLLSRTLSSRSSLSSCFSTNSEQDSPSTVSPSTGLCGVVDPSTSLALSKNAANITPMTEKQFIKLMRYKHNNLGSSSNVSDNSSSEKEIPSSQSTLEKLLQQPQQIRYHLNPAVPTTGTPTAGPLPPGTPTSGTPISITSTNSTLTNSPMTATASSSLHHLLDSNSPIIRSSHHLQQSDNVPDNAVIAPQPPSHPPPVYPSHPKPRHRGVHGAHRVSAPSNFSPAPNCVRGVVAAPPPTSPLIRRPPPKYTPPKPALVKPLEAANTSTATITVHPSISLLSSQSASGLTRSTSSTVALMPGIAPPALNKPSCHLVDKTPPLTNGVYRRRTCDMSAGLKSALAAIMENNAKLNNSAKLNNAVKLNNAEKLNNQVKLNRGGDGDDKLNNSHHNLQPHQQNSNTMNPDHASSKPTPYQTIGTVTMTAGAVRQSANSSKKNSVVRSAVRANTILGYLQSSPSTLANQGVVCAASMASSSAFTSPGLACPADFVAPPNVLAPSANQPIQSTVGLQMVPNDANYETLTPANASRNRTIRFVRLPAPQNQTLHSNSPAPAASAKSAAQQQATPPRSPQATPTFIRLLGQPGAIRLLLKNVVANGTPFDNACSTSAVDCGKLGGGGKVVASVLDLKESDVKEAAKNNSSAPVQAVFTRLGQSQQQPQRQQLASAQPFSAQHLRQSTVNKMACSTAPPPRYQLRTTPGQRKLLPAGVVPMFTIKHGVPPGQSTSTPSSYTASSSCSSSPIVSHLLAAASSSSSLASSYRPPSQQSLRAVQQSPQLLSHLQLQLHPVHQRQRGAQRLQPQQPSQAPSPAPSPSPAPPQCQQQLHPHLISNQLQRQQQQLTATQVMASSPTGLPSKGQIRPGSLTITPTTSTTNTPTTSSTTSTSVASKVSRLSSSVQQTLLPYTTLRVQPQRLQQNPEHPPNLQLHHQQQQLLSSNFTPIRMKISNPTSTVNAALTNGSMEVDSQNKQIANIEKKPTKKRKRGANKEDKIPRKYKKKSK